MTGLRRAQQVCVLSGRAGEERGKESNRCVYVCVSVCVLVMGSACVRGRRRTGEVN